MATNNFYNHENGIFVIEELSLEEAYEVYKQERLDFEEEIEEFDNVSLETLHVIIDMEMTFRIENLDYLFSNGVLPYGMTSSAESDTEFTIYNNKGKVIALVYVSGGCYQHAQLIVETDPYEIFGEHSYYWETKADMLEEYSPNHKRLLKYVASITTPINLVGSFSNGEAVYELA